MPDRATLCTDKDLRFVARLSVPHNASSGYLNYSSIRLKKKKQAIVCMVLR